MNPQTHDPAQQGTLAVYQGEGALVARPEAVENVPIVFVRLSRTAPARTKVVSLPAASGMRLSSTDLTVTIHACVQSSEACWVQVEPQKAEGVLSPVSVLSLSNTDAQTLPFTLRQWSTCKKLVYCFHGQLATPALASLLDRVVSQRAFPGSRISQHVRINSADEQAETALCEDLAHASFLVKSSVDHEESAWALTDQGLQGLVHMHEVCRPKLVFPSVEALLDRVHAGLQEVQGFTSWELLAVLKHKGWQLQPLPGGKKKRRELPAHTHDSTSLICYCGSKNSLTLESPVTKSYMQSLVLSDQLFHAMVSRIHHGQQKVITGSCWIRKVHSRVNWRKRTQRLPCKIREISCKLMTAYAWTIVRCAVLRVCRKQQCRQRLCVFPCRLCRIATMLRKT